MGFLDGTEGKESAHNAGEIGDTGLIPGSGRFPWRRKWQPIPVLPEKISRTEKPVGLQSMGLQRVGHD